MRSLAMCAVVVMGLAMSLGAMLFACGGNNSGNTGFSSSGGASSGSSNGGASSSGTGSSGTGASSGIVFKEDGGGPTGPKFTDGGCAGLQCAIANTCTNDGGTTITGQVMDPVGQNPLYNVLAYVPMFDPADPSAIPAGYGIEPITGGVSFPSGVSCDSCSYLYSGNPIAIGLSDTDGHFTITNAPSGTNIPVVIQVGKWRTHTTVSTVTSCQSADAGAIKMPGTAPASDPIISMPQIAISMGGADSLECLLPRMGIASSEIVSGTGAGHVHIFSGDGAGSVPASSASMWNSLAALEKYDVALFSCEGEEPTTADPQTLEQYVNAGGRAFLSHYHYAWLSGPLQGGGGYTANADWGTHLAAWNSNDEGAGGNAGTIIDTTLNSAAGGTFAKGVALKQWLTNVDALGVAVQGSTPPAGELEVIAPAFDPNVTTSNPLSQPWATYDSTAGAGTYTTAYFSFDTPVGAVAPADGGAPPYCGRVVFSGLHVGGAQSDQNDTMPVLGTTCSNPTPSALTPQEKVLEFMIFDLSACVIPDTATPGIPIPPPPPPPPPQ